MSGPGLSAVLHQTACNIFSKTGEVTEAAGVTFFPTITRIFLVIYVQHHARCPKNKTNVVGSKVYGWSCFISQKNKRMSFDSSLTSVKQSVIKVSDLNLAQECLA